MSASSVDFQGVVQTLSKLADKSFTHGFFIPALLAAISAAALESDHLPPLQNFATAHGQELVGYVSLSILAVWVAAMLLLVTNGAAYKCLEGELWPWGARRSMRSQMLKRHQLQQEIYVLRKQFAQLAEQSNYNSISFDAERNSEMAKLRTRILVLQRQFVISFPGESHLMRPTRFGNIVRAFETYPLAVHGVDGSGVWARLIDVISADFQNSLAQAKARVDFWVNLIFLSAIISGIALARGGAAWGESVHTSLVFYAAALAALTIARISYTAALSSLTAWGDALNSAFDLYLPKLAKRLGYQLPDSLRERQRFWAALSNQITYCEPMHPEEWEKVAEESESPRRSRRDSTESDDEPRSEKAEEGEEGEPDNDESDDEQGDDESDGDEPKDKS